MKNMNIESSMSLNFNNSSLVKINFDDFESLDNTFNKILSDAHFKITAGPSVDINISSLENGITIGSISTTYSVAPSISSSSNLSQLQNQITSNDYNNSISSDKSDITNNNSKNEVSEDTVLNEDIYIDNETSNDLSKDEIMKLIEKISSKYDVDPNLIKAIVQTESSFNPDSKSSSGAVGLMQLMPSAAREMGLTVNGSVDERWNIEKNIEAGVKYLTKYHKMISEKLGTNDWSLTLAGYNAGPYRVIREGKIPEITETKNYVNKVMKYWNEFSQIN